MSDLIERARLSWDEQHQAVFAGSPTEAKTWDGRATQRVADAQLRKALLVVTEWLGEQKLIGEEPSAELVALYRELHPERSVHENVEVA